MDQNRGENEMIERETKTGGDVKICARPSCQAPFTRSPNMKQANWDCAKYCTRHRKPSGDKKGADPRLGHYEVKNPIIDSFLRGRL